MRTRPKRPVLGFAALAAVSTLIVIVAALGSIGSRQSVLATAISAIGSAASTTNPLMAFVVVAGILATIALGVITKLTPPAGSWGVSFLRALNPRQHGAAIDAVTARFQTAVRLLALVAVAGFLTFGYVIMRASSLPVVQAQRAQLLADVKRLISARQQQRVPTPNDGASAIESGRVVEKLSAFLIQHGSGLSPGDRAQLLLAKAALQVVLGQLDEASDSVSQVGPVGSPWAAEVERCVLLIEAVRHAKTPTEPPGVTAVPQDEPAEAKVLRAERLLDSGQAAEASVLLRACLSDLELSVPRAPGLLLRYANVLGLLAMTHNTLRESAVAASYARRGVSSTTERLTSGSLPMTERISLEIAQSQCFMELASALDSMDQVDESARSRGQACDLLERLVVDRNQHGLALVLQEQFDKLVDVQTRLGRHILAEATMSRKLAVKIAPTAPGGG